MARTGPLARRIGMRKWDGVGVGVTGGKVDMGEQIGRVLAACSVIHRSKSIMVHGV